MGMRKVVVCDGPWVHKDEEAVQAIKGAGAHMLFLPPYSPDIMPAERIFSFVKGVLRGENCAMLEQARPSRLAQCDVSPG